jgi:hypothetical protein
MGAQEGLLVDAVLGGRQRLRARRDLGAQAQQSAERGGRDVLESASRSRTAMSKPRREAASASIRPS